MRNPIYLLKALVLLIFIALFTDCSSHRTLSRMPDWDEAILVKVVVNATEIDSTTPLQIEIQIINHCHQIVHFGDDDHWPWLEVTWIDDLKVDTWIGVGKAIPPFALKAGESVVIKRTVTLEEQPSGRYLVSFDGFLKEYGTLPFFTVPAIVVLRER